MTENQRLKILRSTLKIKQGVFAQSIGLKQGSYSEIERGARGTSISGPVLKSLIAKFKVNPLWLYTGYGEMFISSEIARVDKVESTPISTPISTPNSEIKSEPATLAAHLAVVTVDEKGNDNIVMVDTKAAAGYPTRLLETEYYKELPAFKLPGMYRNGTFRAFQVDGDSMMETLDHGDWVICQHLERLEDVREGYIHVVVTREEVSVKRLLNRVKQRQSVVMQSDNVNYPMRTITAAEILEVWLVKAKIGFNLRNRSHDIMRILNNLQADQADLQARITKLEGKKPSKGS